MSSPHLLLIFFLAVSFSQPLTSSVLLSVQVVPKSSAVVPGVLDAESIAITANHLEMTKYLSENDAGFKKVSGHLQLMVQEANIKVQKNWDSDEWRYHSMSLLVL